MTRSMQTPPCTPIPPRLYKTVDPTLEAQIRPLREIRRRGYEHFWVKIFHAWPWMIGVDAGNGKTFWIGSNERSYYKYRDRPAVGLAPLLRIAEFTPDCGCRSAGLNGELVKDSASMFAYSVVTDTQ